MMDHTGSTPIALHAFASWQARVDDPGLRDAWLASERAKADSDWNSLPGRCQLCDTETGFHLAEGADRVQPNLRESLLCRRCQHNARIRAALGLLPSPLRQDGAAPRIYVTEQVTRTFVWMQQHLDGEVIGSEFQPDARKRQVLGARLQAMGGRGEVCFQDVTRLDFADASLDAVVSFDVLEHVPDYRAAILEFGRVLRAGGVCVATFPFTDGPTTVVRARVDAQGQVEHLLEPEYHGDPIGGGVLCYYHFGWDVLDVFRSAGFDDVHMVMPWSHTYGYHYGLWTLVAKKGAA